MVKGTIKSLWFDLSGAIYVARYGARSTLTHDTTNQVFVLTAPDGSVLKFNDFTQTTYPTGLLKNQQAPGGQVTQVVSYTSGRIGEIRRSATQNGTTTTYSFLYTYDAGTEITNLLLRSQVGGGAWTSIRNVVYEYHPGTDSFGSLGDLKRVRVQVSNSSGTFVDNKIYYYRYYVSGESNGFVHGLKYVVNPAAYANMVAAGLDPTSISNATLAQSADQYLQYDVSRRVTLESLDSGSRTYTFAYTPSVNTSDFNNWAMKTVETRPDGSTNTVYTNYIGLILLKQLKSGANAWVNYYQYDSLAHLTMSAMPSAVAGFNDSAANLGVTLNASSGLIQLTDYYTSTGSGAATGYVWRNKVQQGSGGTPVILNASTYTSVTANGATVYPLASATTYRNTDGSGAVTISFAYTYYSGTTQVQQKTTTLPVISTAQNGSGTAATTAEYYDSLGQMTWRMNERGFITHSVFDNPTGALVQRVDDVNTSQASGVPAGWSTPAGGGLNLVTDFLFDNLGRRTQSLGPWHTVDLGGTATSVRRANWTVYQDATYQIWMGQGYATGTSPNYSFTLTNPVSIVINDPAGKVVQQISATRSLTSGALSAADSYPQSSYVRWKTSQFTDCCLPASDRTYFLIPASGTGTAGTNYNETDYGYDSLKRQNVVTSPGGTITFQVFDTRDNAIAKYVGTNATGATQTDPTGGGTTGNNMVLVSEYQYDNGQGGGDNYLTATTEHVDASTTRVTTASYDWRGRQVAVRGPVNYYLQNTYDNLNRVVEADRYNTTASGNLIARSQVAFDDLGRTYTTTTFGVDPSSGTVGNSLVSSKWYDAAGNLTKDQPAGSQVFTKTAYDSLGRAAVSYNGYGSDANYAATQSPSGNTILEQLEFAFDAASNTVQTTNRQRYHNIAASQTGPLGNPGTQPYARATYAASYPDPIGRIIGLANYGTNGGSALSRSATVPTSSSTILVTQITFNNRGENSQVTNPVGRVDQFTFDDAGRQTKAIENYVDGNPSTGTADQDRTTTQTYTADGMVASITVTSADTGDQVTTYTYGSTLAESLVASSLLKRLEIMPDSSGGSDQSAFTYNRLGEVIMITDPNSTVRAFTYDGLGRTTEELVTTLGSGVDATVLRIETGYTPRGARSVVTNFDNATVGQGNVVNQTQFTYNAFNQLIIDTQEPGGAVTANSLSVGYSYANGSSNTIRPTAITYPSGRVLSYSYGPSGGTDDLASRVTALIDNDGSTSLAAYSYLGRDMIIAAAQSQPGTQLALFNLSGTNDPDSGDIYTGWDRFDRVKDQRWLSTGSGADIARIKHGYDPVGNRLYRQDTVAEAASPGFDELYGMDGLYRLTSLQRGTLASTPTTITGKTFAESWALGVVGNWLTYQRDVNGDGTWDLTQNRTANAANEITALSTSTGPAWSTPAFDHVGNMTTLPQPSNPTGRYTATFDGWNRLVKLVDPSTGHIVASFSFDGTGRRVTIQTYSGGSLVENRRFYHSEPSSVSQVLEARIGSFAATDRQFIWGLRAEDDLVLRDRATPGSTTLNERLYAMQDANGNTIAVVNPSGIVQERYAYSAYGQPIFLSAQFTNPSGTSAVLMEDLYTGRKLDTATGLYFYRARFYHPNLGLFLSRDPIGYKPSDYNLYGYVSERPVSATDPTGLQTVAVGAPKPSTPAQQAWCKAQCAANAGAFGTGTGVWSCITVPVTYTVTVLGCIVIRGGYDETYVTCRKNLAQSPDCALESEFPQMGVPGRKVCNYRCKKWSLGLVFFSWAAGLPCPEPDALGRLPLRPGMPNKPVLNPPIKM